ncbi:hypothetical protein RCOM_1134560 [Ricinus communis]|uniref:Uncharacterized protein n=1 Tax=Ricinus communis TaxID=3988 RepID=B9RVE4_RICCO|nr:hypothetical protein RCOM_1134560 [Ricinus communis]
MCKVATYVAEALARRIYRLYPKLRVHVTDSSMNHGMQWPALLQAFSSQTRWSARFPINRNGAASHDNLDHLQEVGWKLGPMILFGKKL